MSLLRLRGRCRHCGAGGYVVGEACPCCGVTVRRMTLVRELHIDYPTHLWLTINCRLEPQGFRALLSDCPGVDRLSFGATPTTPRWFPLQHSFGGLSGKHDPWTELPPRLEEIAEPLAVAVERVLTLRPSRLSVSTAPNPDGGKRRVSASELLDLIRRTALEPSTRYHVNARRL